jgi:hypothetical protein
MFMVPLAASVSGRPLGTARSRSQQLWYYALLPLRAFGVIAIAYRPPGTFVTRFDFLPTAVAPWHRFSRK